MPAVASLTEKDCLRRLNTLYRPPQVGKHQPPHKAILCHSQLGNGADEHVRRLLARLKSTNSEVSRQTEALQITLVCLVHDHALYQLVQRPARMAVKAILAEHDNTFLQWPV